MKIKGKIPDKIFDGKGQCFLETGCGKLVMRAEIFMVHHCRLQKRKHGVKNGIEQKYYLKNTGSLDISDPNTVK